MVAAVSGQLSQAQGVIVVDSPALRSDISQLQAVIVYTKPAVSSSLSQLQTIIVADNPALYAQASQVQAIVIYAGTAANPKIRAWTYSMDTHDFYVLQLGSTGETFVYDTFSEQWTIWGRADSLHWNVGYGMNWIGAGNNRLNYGSDVVCGDDTNGALYFLDPEYPYDDDRDTGTTDAQLFQCQATGQVMLEGNAFVPCGSVKLTGSFGDTYDDSLTAVTLEYSDDAGRTYVDAGTIDIAPADYAARVEWRSLGAMKAPGRMFRITDYGAVVRIDRLEIPNG